MDANVSKRRRFPQFSDKSVKYDHEIQEHTDDKARKPENTLKRHARDDRVLSGRPQRTQDSTRADPRLLKTHTNNNKKR